MYDLNSIFQSLENCKEALLNNKKGSKSSINGNKYEREIYNILKYTYINGEKFNTQIESELGGSSSKNDIICNYNGYKNIGIEIKKSNTPDWMQCSITYNTTTNKWVSTPRKKIPNNCKNIYDELISNHSIFNNNIPPFIKEHITYDEWLKHKASDKWNDWYIDIPNDTIKKLYKEKGCYYIQISDYGLYHLGDDICNFNVPEFIIDQHIRVRIKNHDIKNKNGYCTLSITASCKPKNISTLIKSQYSLDNINSLPSNIVYIVDSNNI